MRRFWLAACAATMLTAVPAQALDIRVDPAPLYVFDLSPDRGGVDLVLHNILVVNNERSAREIRGLRVELLAGGEVVSTGRAGAAAIARRAQRIASLNEAGVLRAMDFQVHLSRLLRSGERLSADASLEPGEAYLNTSFYISAASMPDAARIVVEGERGDLAQVSVPVSRYRSPNQYRAPVAGRWYVFASGDAAHHHRWVISQEYAIDIAMLGPELRSHTGDGTRLRDYVTFGQPVFAAADGVVVAARNDRADSESLLRRPGESYEAYQARAREAQQAFLAGDGLEGALGNYVLIRHAGGEHSVYAHLRQGSVRVAAGQSVRAGQQIGEAGSSGNSEQPHLHFQVIDGPDVNSARGLPMIFQGLRADWISIDERHLRAGDVIERE
jgi:murein DD-endopeptidase MepM/ murein hydrolase activator NlpD